MYRNAEGANRQNSKMQFQPGRYAIGTDIDSLRDGGQMTYPIVLLILAAIALLALIDVGLGQFLPDPYAQGGASVRIGLREFLTRPLPLFLFGLGVAMLPANLAAGAGLLVLAGALALARRGTHGERA
jgi:hypothetical protein